MMSSENLGEKKLRGSGGYAIAKVTDDEQKKGNLGGPELFLAGVGRLDEDRFTMYYCNRCEKEYSGSPAVVYDNPNEELGEGVILLEKGEYKCRSCDSTIAQYRKFDAPSAQAQAGGTRQEVETKASKEGFEVHPLDAVDATDTVLSITDASKGSVENKGFVPIQSLEGMQAYDSDAILLGKVREIGLRKIPGGRVQIALKIEGGNNSLGSEQGGQREIAWDTISKIGDIVLLSTAAVERTESNRIVKCGSCAYQNESDAVFCENCGKKLVE